MMKACGETEIKDVRFINDEILEVQFKDKKNFTYTNSRVNVIIAAFTTCHARLRLYDVIDRLVKGCNILTQTASYTSLVQVIGIHQRVIT
ncbi:hypothetical protein HOLleu_21563 [Holothuria leucospilota]|uniref:Uncharacterized protein n=1 Tax=Holothuria leucospilota TaxID=206669 RepID=A0A9Q1BXW2_HOLLE|nr:hypothetical protein HOLleu_21563 [Holothuria leucospilota]